MNDLPVNIVTLLQPIAISISLVYFYGVISRLSFPTRFRGASMGAMMGMASLAAMAMPVALGDGILFDLRSLFIGIAAGFFGWVAGLVALAMAVAVRISIGGPGVLAGVVGMTLAMLAALAWYHTLGHRPVKSLGVLVMLGLAISAQLAAAVLIPPAFRMVFLGQIAPAMVACTVVGTVVIGLMLQREHLLITETSTLRDLADKDPLTDLVNRRRMEEIYGALAVPESEDQGRATIFFDIDHFKLINDSYGHDAGDEILQVISRRIASCLRPHDIFARLGGDEFAIALPNVSIATAQRVAERCHDVVQDCPITAGEHSVRVTISLGVHWSLLPPDFTADLAQADAALYKSKKAGRNRVTFGGGSSQAA